MKNETPKELGLVRGFVEPTHTPTPWSWHGERGEGFALLNPDGQEIGDIFISGDPVGCKAKANAEFIVRAVNHYDAMRTIILRHMSLNEMNSEIERINTVIAQAETK